MGGTALSVHLKHRRSEDLDIFVYDPFDPLSLLDCLKGQGKAEADTTSCVLRPWPASLH